MKTRIKNLLLLPALIVGLALIPAGRMTAQILMSLHTFDDGSLAFSPGGLTLVGNNLYGSAEDTVFALNTSGKGFSVLHRFTIDEGYELDPGLVLSGNTLYGAAWRGGNTVTNSALYSTSGNGAIFAINTDGSNFSILHYFTAIVYGSSDPSTYTNKDGANPSGPLILSGNTLYGTAQYGGSSGNGTVFALKTNGSGFTVLHDFAATAPLTSTNRDGASPVGGLVLSGNFLYGVATGGGSAGYGDIFAVKADGTGFTNLHSFNPANDGDNPGGQLILSGSVLYGITVNTVFAVNTDGTDFRILRRFTIDDAIHLHGGLALSGNTLYGTATQGSVYGRGFVFALDTNGANFTNLYNFDGDIPNTLILSDDTLYGTTYASGIGSERSLSGPYGGTVFSLSFAPQLAISPSAANVILTWPTNVAGFDYSGFTLQSTTNLANTNSWTALTNLPVTVGSQNMVTNTISGPAKFYRLKK